MTKYKYNWIPDLPDQRDLMYSVDEPIALPEKVDLRFNCPDPYDQGNLGSCTANAGAGAIKFLQKMDKIEPIEDISRLFLYYVTRSLEGTTRWDSGCSIRDTAKAINKFGVCAEELWKYDIRRYRNKPPIEAYNDALNHKSILYRRVNGIIDIKTVLAMGYPIIFGFTVYSSFESDNVSKTGIVPMPTRRERSLGGHAVLLCGYDNTMLTETGNGYFICENSWGNGFGDSGFFYLPYSYFPLMSDFWLIQSVNNY
jgi:C1A family cysteine protease